MRVLILSLMFLLASGRSLSRIIVCAPGDPTLGLGTEAAPFPLHRLVELGSLSGSYGTYSYEHGDTLQLLGDEPYFAVQSLHAEIEIHFNGAPTDMPDANNKLVIMPYPGHKPTFKPWDSTASDEGGRTAIVSNFIPHVYFISLRFDLSNVTGDSSYHGGLQLVDDGGPDSCGIINCEFLAGVQVVFRDQATITGTLVYNCTFIYAGRSGWSNYGYPNYTANSRSLGLKTYENNFEKDLSGSVGAHFYSQSGDVDSIHIVHHMRVQSNKNQYLVNAGFNYWNASSQTTFIKSGTDSGSHGIRIDSSIHWTAYDFTTKDDDPLFACIEEDKYSRYTRIRYTWLLRGYLKTQTNGSGPPNSFGRVVHNLVQWSDRYPQGPTGVDTNWADKFNNRMFVGSTKPSLEDRLDFLVNRFQAKRARLHGVNLDSSASVVVPAAKLALAFAAGDTLRIVDLQNHPDSTWDSQIWNGVSDVTITVPGIGAPYYDAPANLGNPRFMGAVAFGNEHKHTTREVFAMDIIASGEGAPAGEGSTTYRGLYRKLY